MTEGKMVGWHHQLSGHQFEQAPGDGAGIVMKTSFFIQFSSVTQSYLTLCNPMNHSTPGLPVHHHLPEFTQTQGPSSL